MKKTLWVSLRWRIHPHKSISYFKDNTDIRYWIHENRWYGILRYSFQSFMMIFIRPKSDHCLASFCPFFKLDLSWHDKLLNGFVKNTDCIYPFPEMNFEKKFVPSAAKCSHIPIVLTPTRCFLFLIFSFILHQPLYGKYLRLNGFHGLLRWWFQDYPIKPRCGLIIIARLPN